MFGQIEEIKNLAFKYSKEQLGRMAQMGMIEPQKAMMAGMMRDRVAKEDTKPPATTVAQDVLAPQQMGMAPQAQPQEPVQMAATGGITSLPVQDQDYAGGGIVAFADGGDTDEHIPRYNGNALDGSQVMYDNAKVTDAGGYRFPSGSLFGMFERRQSSGADAMDELQRLDAQIAQTPPGPMRDRMIQTREFTAAKAAKTNTQQFPSGIIATPEGQQAQQDMGAITNPFNAPAANTPAAAAPAPGANKAPAGTGNRPRLPALNEPTGDIAVEKYTPKPVQELDVLAKERSEAYRKAGIDTDLYKGMIEKEEGKREGLGKRKEEAKGEFLMNLGLGLTQAKRGQEFAALGAGAKEGLASYKESMKDVRLAEEKLEDRINSFKLADQQAKKTGTDADIAKRDRQKEMLEAADSKFVDAKNAAAAKTQEIKAHIFDTKTRDETARYVAGVQAATQRDYTAALKAQGLDVQRQRILIDAASDYVSKNGDKPAYMGKPELLQADAIAFSRRLAAEMGVTVPGGGTQIATPSNRPSLSSFQRQPT